MSRRKASFFLFCVILLVAVFGVVSVQAAECFELSDEVGFVCDARPGESQFTDPDRPADSFLDRVVYAKIHDLANVHDSPGGRVIRNVGDGFLYATIFSVVEANGSLWYQINLGEYIHQDFITVVDLPDFHGVEINVQPDRPFGWIVQEVRPSSAPTDDPNPEFSKLERLSFFQVFDAVEASDGWIWYDIGGDRWIRQTYVSLVDVSPRPAEVGPDEFWVEIDLYEQTFAAYEGNRMVYATLVSSGLNQWPTHEGIFQVWDRHEATKMSGAEGEVDYYFIEEVPHTMYFDYDIALHGAYWHDRYGYKHSHGCVNMPPYDAEWVFWWSEQADNDLWVWVHTSDPMDYFLTSN